ncbi:carboxypeptidase-like regulatory domain-containing protein [Marinifilum flexuosum]|uniref:Carboxypeptidase-like protein n=1 Tax=Marinifilum flexuosum TaxID=1117708 RepID=A0A419X787_9BACT|nr:carboxypeptidase-like regulatory domain-containing protein [Marinifilum flexuosum]RKE03430.1 carboxypeptidase-like protein [Marinifilum flexuosum]
MKIFLKFILILFLSANAFYSNAQSFLQDSTLSISGLIYSSKTNEAIPNATVTIKRSRKGVICDSTGVFHLQIQERDTLVISALGYELKEWPVPIILNPDFPPFFRIKLQDISYLLKEVDIYALGTWDEFKDEFVKAKVKEKNPINKDIGKQLAPYNTKKPDPVPAQYRPKIDKKMGIVDAIFRPTDFLHNKLSKKEKIKKKLSKRIKEEGKNKKIGNKYNAQIVSDATGLKGDELVSFMEFCGKKIHVTENSRDYDVMKQILDLYEEYTTKEE